VPNDTAGDMKQYKYTMDDYITNQDSYNQPNPWEVKWCLIGPPSHINATSGSPFYGQCMGKITALYVDLVTDRSGNTIYAGAESSGLWKTEDRGEHWNCVTDVLPLSCGVQDIAGDPIKPNVIYIATGTNSSGIAEYGKGIMKSTNGGASWISIYNPSSPLEIVHRIFVDPLNGQHIFALVNDDVIRSLDGGKTWYAIFGNPGTSYKLTQDYAYKHKYLIDIEMKPGDSNTLYIASTGFEDWDTGVHYRWHQAEIWKTSNALVPPDSISWTRLDSTNFSPLMVSKRFELAVTPADPECVYVIGSDSLPSDQYVSNRPIRIYKSNDNGDSWHLQDGHSMEVQIIWGFLKPILLGT
jgi:hypothetical protein